MHLISGLASGYLNKDVDEFLELLARVCVKLDTLGQIQKCAGGSSMDSRASQTFNDHALLVNTLAVLKASRRKEM